jgi:carbon-monoxide dehydrogenase medium subunit
MADFVTGPFQNSLLPGEIAVEARIPAPVGTPHGRYLKLERRVGDFATVGVAVALDTDGDTVTRAGIALTGVGGNNIKVTAAEDALVGSTLDRKVVEAAARLAAEAAQPRSDHRGSADYKRHVVRTFVTRALESSAVVAA